MKNSDTLSRMTEYLPNLVPVVRATGFWSAICLPWVALVLLVTGTATNHPLWFTAVILATVIAAAIGQNHSIN